MHIKKLISIENYRNLSNVAFEFEDDINFVVGENNVGKTNLIELLTAVFRTSKFYEEDFYDVKEQIKVIFEIQYDHDEVGFFDNMVNNEETYSITITAIQEDPDARVEYYHTQSGEYINPKKIKMMNFIYFACLRSSSKEFGITKDVKTEKVLTYIMKKSLEQRGLLNKEERDHLMGEVNEKLKGLSSDGIQYSLNIFLNILELLVHLKTTKKEAEYQSLLVKKEDGKKYLPLILGLDEPENHQHPYRQGSVIKGIRKIIDNEHQAFLEIVKRLFDIDGFIGQVFVITHSPNILLDNYKQIVRVYKQGDNVAAKCGYSLNFEQNVYKHLRRSFIYFKEAMFAKKVILVEGDTEFGAVPIFAKRLGYDLDDEGIGVVKLDGADGVIKYLKLFKAFKIDAIAILDKDKKPTYVGNPDIRFTLGEDFEEDVFDAFGFDQYIHYLKNIGKHTRVMSHLRGAIKGFDSDRFRNDPTQLDVSEALGKKIMLKVRDAEIKNLKSIKNVVNGALMAGYCDQVPESFKSIIEEAISK